jgi:hypothetical protein
MAPEPPVPKPQRLEKAVEPQDDLTEQRRRLIEDIAWLVLRRLRRSADLSRVAESDGESSFGE